MVQQETSNYNVQIFESSPDMSNVTERSKRSLLSSCILAQHCFFIQGPDVKCQGLHLGGEISKERTQQRKEV